MRPILVALVAAGCATPLSTLTTADTLPKGDMQIAVGSGYYLPLGQLVKTTDLAYNLGKKFNDSFKSGTEPTLTDAEKKSMLEAGLSLALAPPAAMFEAGFRYGALDGLELGLRYSPSSWRLDAKWRLWRSSGGAGTVAVALMPAASRFSFSSIVLDLLEYVKVDDFSRYDFDLPLLASMDFGQIFKLYGAARVSYGRYSLDEKLLTAQQVATSVVQAPTVLQSVSGSIIHAGGTLGAALGYKYVFAYLELGVHQAMVGTRLLGQNLDLGGLVVYPAFGLTAAW